MRRRFPLFIFRPRARRRVSGEGSLRMEYIGGQFNTDQFFREAGSRDNRYQASFARLSKDVARTVAVRRLGLDEAALAAEEAALEALRGRSRAIVDHAMTVGTPEGVWALRERLHTVKISVRREVAQRIVEDAGVAASDASLDVWFTEEMFVDEADERAWVNGSRVPDLNPMFTGGMRVGLDVSGLPYNADREDHFPSVAVRKVCGFLKDAGLAGRVVDEVSCGGYVMDWDGGSGDWSENEAWRAARIRQERIERRRDALNRRLARDVESGERRRIPLQAK